MKGKDAAIIKVLSDIGYADEPELTTEQEKQFERALDPEKQFLHDVEQLFTPQIQEDAWDDAENRRTTPNPLPVGDEKLLNRVFDMGDDLESKQVAKYRATKKYANTPFPELAKRVREELGTMMDVPISQVVALEKYLDGEHLNALVHNKPTTNPSGVITLIKFQNKYYIQDGTHRIAAAAFNGDETIHALVIDVNKPGAQ